MTDTDAASDFRSPLDKWLWRHRRTARWLADRIGVHEGTISRLRSGDKSRASEELLQRVKEATGLRSI